MKFNVLFLVALAGLFVFSACDKPDETPATDPMYHAHIHAPDDSDKTVGETIDLKVDFEDMNGGKVHHIKVRVYNKATDEEIYNGPSDAHVHADPEYTLEDTVTLDVDADTEWVVEAKVWGHEAGLFEEIATKEFKVVN